MAHCTLRKKNLVSACFSSK